MSSSTYAVMRWSGGHSDHKYETLGVFETEYDANVCLAAAEAKKQFEHGCRVSVLLFQSETRPSVCGTIIGRTPALGSSEEWCPVMYTVELDRGQLPGSLGAPLQNISRKKLRPGVSGTNAQVELSRDLIVPIVRRGAQRPDDFGVMDQPRNKLSPSAVWFSHFDTSDREDPTFGSCFSSDQYCWDTFAHHKCGATASREAEKSFNDFLSGVRQREDGHLLKQVPGEWLWRGSFPETHRSRFIGTDRSPAPLCYSKAWHKGLFLGMFRDTTVPGHDHENFHWAEKHVVRKASAASKKFALRKKNTSGPTTANKVLVKKAGGKPIKKKPSANMTSTKVVRRAVVKKKPSAR